MKVLELFSGSMSFSKVAAARGHKTFTSDFVEKYGSNYCVDIMDFDIKKIPFKPDIIWASPPCTTFSVASIGHHWNKDNTPKTEAAAHGVEIIKKTIEIIEALKPKYWIIENPRGKLRKLNLMGGVQPITVTYCQYGDSRMKPTDLWVNFDWTPRQMCKNGEPCHTAAPRGTEQGTQGIRGAYIRSIVPPELCEEILQTIERLENGKKR